MITNTHFQIITPSANFKPLFRIFVIFVNPSNKSEGFKLQTEVRLGHVGKSFMEISQI